MGMKQREEKINKILHYVSKNPTGKRLFSLVCSIKPLLENRQKMRKFRLDTGVFRIFPPEDLLSFTQEIFFEFSRGNTQEFYLLLEIGQLAEELSRDPNWQNAQLSHGVTFSDIFNTISYINEEFRRLLEEKEKS